MSELLSYPLGMIVALVGGFGFGTAIGRLYVRLRGRRQ